MEGREFAIVDIETTGGSASTSRITEMALVIHDGTRVVDRWETLVNPEMEIPSYITRLTGIDGDMVRKAPVFSEISIKVFELLSGRVFVAHNVNFDYSFLKHQLAESGISWSASKLCTVRASRKIFPGLKSYSLGNLCQSLKIPILNRHRAGGDLTATVAVFERLLSTDHKGEMKKMLKRSAADQRLPSNVSPEDFQALPQLPGVYYFYDRGGKIIYVGKAVNLKKRVASHFSGHNISQRRQQFLSEIHRISFEVCGSELTALLLECAQIRKLWPVYNTALKRFEARYGLYEYKARNGFRYLVTGKLGKHQPCAERFHSALAGMDALRELAGKFGIDHRFCRYGGSGEVGFDDLSPWPDVALHNESVEKALESLKREKPSFAILDSGRDETEKSMILVEQGRFAAMGYLPADVDLSDWSVVAQKITTYTHNQYSMQLIESYALRNPEKVVFLSESVFS